MYSLRDIEQTIGTFWTNKDARQWLVSGANTLEMPPCLKSVNLEILRAADPDGVALYGRMINYGHHDVMDSIFPYCSQLLGDDWYEVVEEYLLRFPPDHYNLNHICRHFAEFLSKYGQVHLKRFPFLSELADYEWLELEKIEDTAPFVCGDNSLISSPEQIITMAPIVNATMVIRYYKYPIAEIAARLESGRKVRKKTQPQDTYLAIFRDPETHKVRFLELGKAACGVVEAASKGLCSYQSLLQLAVSLSPELAPDQAVLDFLQLVEDLQKAFLFTGSQRRE